MRIAVVQHDISWETPQENFEAIRPQIAEAAETGAGLIALTETFSWGFTMNTDKAREAPDGPSTEFLLDQAQSTGAWVVGSIPIVEGEAALPNNRMTFAGPKGQLSTYNKIHPFTYGGEDQSYRAGADHLTITIEGLRISAFICYDLRFADEFWALAPDTDCYLVISNWPSSRRHHWKSLLMARAIENQAWVVGTNRVGEDPTIAYAGDSRIIDPFGELVAELPDEPGILTADIDPARVAQVREQFPFLADRR
jgi:predicted amidohydrolase